MIRENWYEESMLRLNKVESNFDEKNKKTFKITLFRHMLTSKRELILEGCQECVENIEYLEEMLTILELNSTTLSRMPNDYKVLLNNLLEHLNANHKITLKREYTIMLTKNLGTIGGLLSLIFFDGYYIVLGTAGSLCLGFLIGGLLDYRKKRKKLIL